MASRAGASCTPSARRSQPAGVGWPPTLACLRDQETGGLFAFLDEAQRVFERYGEGWQPGQIALLVTGRKHQLQKEVLDYHGWDGYWDAFFAGDDVFYGHVLGFEGLERPVVVLAMNGIRDQSRAREYLYRRSRREGIRRRLGSCRQQDLVGRRQGDRSQEEGP